MYTTKIVGLKGAVELGSSWNLRSCSAAELDSFDLERAVLLVTAKMLKTQTYCVLNSKPSAVVGGEAAGFHWVTLACFLQPIAWLEKPCWLPNTKL